MPKLPGVNHQRAIKAFEKVGFQITRQGKHITMTDGKVLLPFREQTLLTLLRWLVL
jgi:predicted RNA binding protein YcfA (HicA-like mRNA interferase family)